VRLSSFPRPASLADYEVAARELENALDALPGRVAVVATGAVSVPGISDLDRIVVLDGGAAVPDVWKTLSPRTRELAMHGPFAIDVETFGRHRELAYVEPLATVRGAEVDVASRPDAELLTLLLAAEGATVLLLQLAKTTVAGTAKVRPLLCLLHGLRHDLALAGLTRDDAPTAWRLADDVAALRAEWFESSDPTRRFIELLAAAPAAVGSALDAMAPRAEAFVDARPSQLALHAPWTRARVRSGASTSFRARRVPLLRGRRPGEAAWRVLGADVRLPAPVLALLAGAVTEPFRAPIERRRTLASAYARSCPDGYGALGLAQVFLP
jgi:hypothetical protein